MKSCCRGLTDRPEFANSELKLIQKSRDLIILPRISEMAVSSEIRVAYNWPSGMVQRGASALGGTDGRGNCSHVMFIQFQCQALPTYSSFFAGEFPLQQGCNLEWRNIVIGAAS